MKFEDSVYNITSDSDDALALSKKKYNRHLPLNFPDPKLSQGSLPRNVHLLLSVTTNLKQTACMHADETLIIAIISFN
jgi:hypothetical protein